MSADTIPSFPSPESSDLGLPTQPELSPESAEALSSFMGAVGEGLFKGENVNASIRQPNATTDEAQNFRRELMREMSARLGVEDVDALLRQSEVTAQVDIGVDHRTAFGIANPETPPYNPMVCRNLNILGKNGLPLAQLGEFEFSTLVYDLPEPGKATFANILSFKKRHFRIINFVGMGAEALASAEAEALASADAEAQS